MEFTIQTNDETKMPISEREAEQQYPTQYWDGTKVVRMLDRDTDDLQQAYICGRTAEPCREQIEAVAKMLAVANMYYDADRDEYDVPSIDRAIPDGGDQWSYRTVGQAGNLMHVARMLLDAARDAVDEKED